ncbi:MAG: hypothetical protein COB41_00385 [Proteobacteria bacterium]|nr:MAG: hypothetical protein COB41_00385 [Pseudomonadota bacterium]
MSITVVINNTSFKIPSPGEDPGWGDDTTAYLVEVSKVLNSLLGPGDLLETTFNVANDISVAEDIVGLAFDTGTVRAVIIEYSSYRVSDANPSGNAETGVLMMIYDNSASAGNKWLLVQDSSEDSGITFSVTDVGQFQYTSTDIDSTNYSGVLKFKARTLSQ